MMYDIKYDVWYKIKWGKLFNNLIQSLTRIKFMYVHGQKKIILIQQGFVMSGTKRSTSVIGMYGHLSQYASP